MEIVQNIFKVFCSTLELFATLVATLSLFRFPLRYNFIKLAASATFVSLIDFFIFNNFSDYLVLTNIVCLIILVMILLNIPLLYSLLVCIIGYLFLVTFEYGVILGSTKLNLLSVESINTNFLHASGVYLATSFIFFLLTYILQKKKLGFMFMANWLTMKKALKKYNFILSSVLIVALLVLQLVSMSYNQFSLDILPLILLTLALLFGIFIAYRQNKKLLNERYERLKNTSKG